MAIRNCDNVATLSYLCLLLSLSFVVKTENEECILPDELIPPSPGPQPNCKGPLKNVALHKPAKQSSQSQYGADAGRAVDGNTDQLFDGKSCSHTSERNDFVDPTPWLTIDLGALHAIQNVVLYSRNNPCCAQRYHDIQIRVGKDFEYGIGNVFSRNSLCDEIIGDGFEQGHVFNFTCSECLVGRYVSVQIVRKCQTCNSPESVDSNILSICEIEVYGHPICEWDESCIS